MSIHIHLDGGLGNRIKGLLSGLRISDRLNEPFSVNWVNNIHMLCSYDQLFDIKLNSYITKNDKVYASWRFVVFEDELPADYKPINNLLRRMSWIGSENTLLITSLRWLPDVSVRFIDFEYDNIPITVIAAYVPYFNKLRASEAVTKLLIDSGLNPDINTLGVHIRRGDTIIEHFKNYNTLDKYIVEIDKHSGNIFLCTDDELTQQQLKKRYGNRLTCYEKISYDRMSILGNQQGLVDMLLLSKCGNILGSPLSTFTECAWWFGGCKANIKIIGMGWTP